MPDQPGPAQGEASRCFEELWREAKEGPKTAAVIKTKRIEIDLTPLTMLKYLREVAGTSHSHGEMKDDEYKLVIQSSKQLEAAFSGLSLAKFYDHLQEIKDRLRRIRDEHGLDQPRG